MATIVTRAGKGSPLTHNEVDANFNNLNNDKVEESTTITAGTGLTGGGDLSANRTISLANTAVAAGSYGSASAVGTFTVDAQGRLTAASNTNIAIANTAVSGLGTMSTQNANSVAITGGSINGTTVGASTASTGAFTTLSASSGATISGGNLAFTTTAQRITGDFSNATPASRLAFQSSTSNGNTNVMVLPNGTGTVSGVVLESSSDLNSSSNTQLLVINGSDSRITSGIRGTGTYLPMTFYTGGSERVRIDTSGNVGIGTGSPETGFRLHVVGNAFVQAASGTVSKTVIDNADQRLVLGAYFESGVGQYSFINSTNNAETGGLDLIFRAGTTDTMRISSTGNVGIGGTAPASTKISLLGTAPVSSGISFGYYQNLALPSTTTSAYLNYTIPTINSGATVTTLAHFYAAQGTFTGAATSQYGFLAESTLTGATNNYGFFSNIASGSNRWNFYAAGTAQNYFAGDVGIGRTPAASTRLSIKGQNNGTGTFSVYVENSTPTEMFKIRDDGTFYTGVASNSPYNLTTANAANVYVDSDGILRRSTSSLRYKSDVTDATHGLAEVLKLRSVNYKTKTDGDRVFGGLIAEEVHDAGLTEFVAYDKDGQPDAIHYGNMVALLVKAVQELTARVAELEAK